MLVYDRDGLIPTLVGALVAMGANYAVDSWQKAKPGSPWPTVVHTAVGVAALSGRRWVRSDWAYEALEALGYGAFGRLGSFVAANTKTLPNVPPSNIPMLSVKTSLAMARAAAAEIVPFPSQPQPQPVVVAADGAAEMAPEVPSDLGFESEI